MDGMDGMDHSQVGPAASIPIHETRGLMVFLSPRTSLPCVCLVVVHARGRRLQESAGSHPIMLASFSRSAGEAVK